MIVKMALRNILRQPRRSLLLGAAIAFAVLVMSLLSGFQKGMEQSMQDSISFSSGGHILISAYTRRPSGSLQRWSANADLADAVKKQLGSEAVVNKTLSVQSTMIFGSKEQTVKLRGVDWQNDRLFTQGLVVLAGSLEAAKTPRGLLLGKNSAERFGLALGDAVMVHFTTVSGQQNVTEYLVQAIYDDSLLESGLATALVSYDDLRLDCNMQQDAWQALSICLSDASHSDAAAETLRAALPSVGYALRSAASDTSAGMGASQGMGKTGIKGAKGGGSATTAETYTVAGLSELSGQLGDALTSLRWIRHALFIIMLVLVAAGITNNYRMVIIERYQEIGTLRCIGFSRRSVFALFTIEALGIAVIAGLVGLAASIPLAKLLERLVFDSKSVLGPLLRAGHLVFTLDLLWSAYIVVAVLCMACAAIAGPARRAAAMQPAQALSKV